MNLTIPLSRLKSIVLLLFLLFLTFMITVASQKIADRDSMVYITFTINGILWVAFLIKDLKDKAFSLSIIHWLFCIFFFFFAGMIQSMNSRFPWIGDYKDSDLIKTNIVLLLWTLCFRFGQNISNYSFSAKRKQISKNGIRSNSISWDGFESKVIALSICAIAITLYRIVFVGFRNLFSRATSNVSISDNSSLAVLIDKFALATVYFAVVFSIYYLQHKKQYKYFFVCSLCLLISYFPTSTSRNAIAGLYFGALLAFCVSAKKKRWFVILYMLLFIIIFPLLNAFRSTAFSDVSFFKALNNTIKNLSSSWLAVDYDAYSMVSLTIRYVERNGITWGYQLLGVALFFVPRSIWHSKPISSGPFIAEKNGWWFTNVSEPLPAEMIINFGIIGMAISGILIGYFIGKIDKHFWNSIKCNSNNIYRFDSLYYYMIGYFLFLFRGALLSAVAYLVPFIVLWWVLTRDSSKEEVVESESL